MKKTAYLLSLISIIFFGAWALAQVASPTIAPVASPTPPPPSIGDVILQVFGLIQSWKSMSIFAAVSVALKLLIDGLKSLGLFDKLVPQKFQALVVLVIGVVTVGLGVLASGGSVPAALSAAVGSSSGAMLLHEIWQDLFPQAAAPQA